MTVTINNQGRYNLSKFVNYTAIFVTLYFSSGFVATSALSGTVRMGVMAIVVCAALFFNIRLGTNHDNGEELFSWCSAFTKLFNSQKTGLIVLCLAILFSAISALLNKQGLFQYAILWIMICIGFFASAAIEKNAFAIAFTDVMVFLSVWSLLFFLLPLINQDSLSWLPSYTNSTGYTVYNAGFTVNPILSSSQMYRNFGVFWEPGCYQIYLNFALVFSLFLNKSKPRPLASIILVITLLTTFSTAGMVIMFGILAIYILSLFRKKGVEEKSQHIKLTISFAVILLSFFFILTFLPPRYGSSVVNKLVVQVREMIWMTDVITPTKEVGKEFDIEDPRSSIKVMPTIEQKDSVSTELKLNDEADEQAVTSSEDAATRLVPQNTFATGRIAAFWYPFQAFLQHPLTGIGHDALYQMQYDYGYIFNTFTPINWFAENGVLFGLLMIVSFICIVIPLDAMWWHKVLLALLLFMAIGNETLERNASLYMMMFWGIRFVRWDGGKKRFTKYGSAI